MKYLRKRTKPPKYPKNFCFFDTETDLNRETGEHSLRLIAWTYGQRLPSNKVTPDFFVETSTEPDGFVESLCDMHTLRDPVYVFAHNLAFDSRVLNLITLLKHRGFSLRVAKCWKTQFSTCLFFVYREKPYIFLDSMNLYGRTALATIGKRLGLPKLSVEFSSVTSEELEVYAKRDVQILAKAVFHYLETIQDTGSGSFRYTVAGQALERLQTTARTTNARNVRGIVFHTHKRAQALERSAYFGGRCEAFQVGYFEECVTLDIRSLYGHIMRSFDLPGRIVKYTDQKERLTLDQLTKALKKYAVIAHVTVSVPRETKIPPFPMRDTKGKVFYPVGTFQTVLCTHSLHYALTAGMITEIHRVALYERTTVLRHYAAELLDTMEKAQQSGEKNKRAILKLLLNSITGRFARKKRFTEPIKGRHEDGDLVLDYDTGHTGTVAVYGDESYITWKTEEPHEWSFCAISAHINCTARMYMYKIYTHHEERLLYTDTDSLILSGYLPEDDSQSSGAAVLCDHWKELTVFREKYYRGTLFDGTPKRVCSGISRSAVELSEHEFRTEQWNAELRKLDTEQKPTTRTVTKIIDPVTKKREVLRVHGRATQQTQPLQAERIKGEFS